MREKMMKRTLPLLLVSLAAPALAQPMSGEITAACMQAMGESEAMCACVEEQAAAGLTADQQTFFLAIMTEDEVLAQSLIGFTDADAEVVQNTVIQSAMQCSG